MPNLIYPYLIGVASTVVIPAVAIVAYIAAHLRGVEYERRRRRLPLATRYEDLEMRVADLQQQHDDLAAELAEAHRVIDEADRERKWLDQHREDIAQMRVEAEQLERHRQEYDRITGELADQREKLEQASKDLKSAEWELEQRQSQIADADRRLAEHENRFKESNAELSSLKEQIKAAEAALKEANVAHDKARQEAAGLQEREAALRAAVEDLAEKRKELSGRLEELERKAEAAEVRRSGAEADLAGVEARVHNLNKQLGDLQAKAGIPNGDVALAELWAPAVAESDFSSEAQQATEDGCVAKVEEYLRSLGLVFPTRTVKAFHTALKTADQTPLLVLAGISGTGKSLLPRRYAEAMGMHFLAVPVQPRWDGPQDLVGFYNYLESRYKATELARALIQFDEYSADWVPDTYEGFLDDRLLIVLLDEMNLARVEYYFSEFLSRLETRRDIASGNASDRAKASLLLDLANLELERPPRVFVDSNVMFVGTMNEDESTMTLSDKVLDRAAMMRFGRPPTLRVREEGPAPERTTSYLSRSTWSEWIDAGKRRGHAEQTRSAVNELNEALTGVGRPFGYRTSDAILEYVRQYPDQSERGRNDAIADQIEQRILPRLRGLDIADDQVSRAIQTVRDLAVQVGDQPLASAIDDALMPQGGHLFQWSGVSRPSES